MIWFGMPPLLKLWIDEVFDRNWLKEDAENPIKGKEVFFLITTGGKEKSFQKDGTYQYTIDEMISGLIVSLRVFGAEIKEMMIVYEAEKLSKKQIITHKLKFVELLNQ